MYVAQWNGTKLVPRGSDILVADANTLALSGDGSRVAVWDDFHVRTFQWNGEDWDSMGKFLADNYDHKSLHFSYDGTWLGEYLLTLSLIICADELLTNFHESTLLN